MDVKCATCKYSAGMDTKESCICWDCTNYEYYEPAEEMCMAPEKEQEKDLDEVNHPSHYLQGSVESIDIMYMMFGAEMLYNFCIVNAYKYMHRHKHKGGKKDLEKAEWYMHKANEIAKYGSTIEYDHAQEMGEVLRKLKGAYEHEETKS